MLKSRNVILSRPFAALRAGSDGKGSQPRPTEILRCAQNDESGFSLVEVLVALLVLTIVITTTIYMFTQRTQHLREANETILAYQSLANEAEIWRRISFANLETSGTTFLSDTTILAPLAPFSTAVKVDKTRADVKDVTLTIRWQNGQKQARLALVRVDTGGTNLW